MKKISIEDFIKMSPDEVIQYGESIPKGLTLDDNKKVSSLKPSAKSWTVYSHNNQGQRVSEIKSNGFWEKIFWTKYSDSPLASENSEGIFKIKNKIVSKNEYDEIMSKLKVK